MHIGINFFLESPQKLNTIFKTMSIGSMISQESDTYSAPETSFVNCEDKQIVLVIGMKESGKTSLCKCLSEINIKHNTSSEASVSFNNGVIFQDILTTEFEHHKNDKETFLSAELERKGISKIDQILITINGTDVKLHNTTVAMLKEIRKIFL